jgi:hypothetical protein
VNELPRRPIEPLSPPPGQFDTVLARARYRRHRKVTTVLTVSTVFLAGVAGGISLSGGISQVPTRVVEAAQRAGIVPTEETSSAEASPTVSARVKPSKRPRVTRTATVEVPPPVAAQPKPRGALAVRGRAVNTDGEPVAGLYVYVGMPGVDGFVPTRSAVTRTAADGSFSLGCTRTPVLLSPWKLNAPAGGAAATARYAATFVGGATDAALARDATCKRTSHLARTVVKEGSAVAGSVEIPAACADVPRAFWLWLHNDRRLTVRVTGLLDGSSFRVAGLPPGEHTVGAGGIRTKVTVGGGTTLAHDVTFGCDVVPVPSQTPSTAPSPSPAPTPSESGSEPSPGSTSGSPSSSAVPGATSEVASGSALRP